MNFFIGKKVIGYTFTSTPGIIFTSCAQASINEIKRYKQEETFHFYRCGIIKVLWSELKTAILFAHVKIWLLIIDNSNVEANYESK